jgi:hypothetical protein
VAAAAAPMPSPTARMDSRPIALAWFIGVPFPSLNRAASGDEVRAIEINFQDTLSIYIVKSQIFTGVQPQGMTATGMTAVSYGGVWE